VILGWIGYLIGQQVFDPSMGTSGLLLGILLNFLWVVPTYVIVNRYYLSLHYEMHEEEMIMHVGVLTKTVKHVPFRTITNLKVKRGPLDRLFGLGTIDIQTAGRSGEGGAEESLVGLKDFKTVYDQIASNLRRYRSPLSPTQGNEDKVLAERKTLQQMLDEIRRIRQLIEHIP
jgi:membrane protein YdbS with pleckstrin-like domain